MKIKKETITLYIHDIRIGKMDLTFKFRNKRSKKAILHDVANSIVYIDRDYTTNEILFYKKSTDMSRGSGFMEFFFDFDEDDFTKEIIIDDFTDNNDDMKKLFYILLEHFNQN